MARLKFWLQVLAALACGSAQAANIVTNGGFETGNFAGWTVVNNGGTSGCGNNVWVVNSTGAQGCTDNGDITVPPNDGAFAAYNTFDGTANPYLLIQLLSVPIGVVSAQISFEDQYQMSYSGNPRTFTVDVYDASGMTLLGNIYSVQPGSYETVGWTSHTFDVTSLLQANAGQQVQLRFSNLIPDNYSGGAAFGLDAISLDVQTTAVPEPGLLALLGIGAAAATFGRRRRHQGAAVADR